MSAKAAVADGMPEGEGGGANKKKKLVLIAIVLVVVLAVGGGAAWFLLGGKKKGKGHKAKGDEEHAEQAQDDDGGEHDDEPEDDGHKAKPPVFVTLEPFTVNLAAEASDRYLQVGVDVKVASAEIGDKIKQHLPEIRNGILMILTSKKVEELGTLEGKNRLRVEIRDAVNKPLGTYRPAPEGADPLRWKPRKGAVDVLLTSFVIQ